MCYKFDRWNKGALFKSNVIGNFRGKYLVIFSDLARYENTT